MKPNLLPRCAAPTHLARAVSLPLPRTSWPSIALSCAVLAILVQPASGAVTEAWVQRYNSPASGEDSGRAVAVDSGGNVVVTGGAYNGQRSDFYTAKYAAADGALLWEQRYHGPNSNWDDTAVAVALDADGNVIVTGGSAADGLENGTYDMYTAKYAAADGTLLWENRFNGPDKRDDFGYAVAVDSSGNVVVTGKSEGLVNNFYRDNFYTAKYAAADGALLWEKSYSPGAVTAMALDESGNVVVTGQSYDSSTGFIYTAKYAAADGALLWVRKLLGSYVGPGPRVAVDGNGHVALALGLKNDSSSVFYTAKYAAADGALLWENRYNGPANRNEGAAAVAVDKGGNVVASGWSQNEADYNYEWYTAKYAAANGALVWEKRHNGPANGRNFPGAVAVDSGGNAVVTGDRWYGTDDDYYTAKYAAADGALLWEKRYNGPASGGDNLGGTHSIALGSNGMIAITGSSAGSSGTRDFATIVYWENLPPVSIAMAPEGASLRFTGFSGHSYNIERAPAVTGPWSTIATPTAPPGGLVEYTDTNPPPGTAFYRTSAP